MAERMQRARNEGGFTLVELAIVLVIIGIILGGVLKGQDLIDNARAKRLVSDAQGMGALAYTFYDRYGRFPGDCNRDGIINYVDFATTPATFGAAAAPAFCAGAGAVADDQWNELIQAGLQANAAPAALAVGPYPGSVKSFSGGTLVAGRQNAVVITGVPCYAAKMADNSIDGAQDAGSGVVRQIVGGAVINVAGTAWAGCANEQNLTAFAYLL